MGKTKDSQALEKVLTEVTGSIDINSDNFRDIRKKFKGKSEIKSYLKKYNSFAGRVFRSIDNALEIAEKKSNKCIVMNNNEGVFLKICDNCLTQLKQVNDEVAKLKSSTEDTILASTNVNAACIGLIDKINETVVLIRGNKKIQKKYTGALLSALDTLNTSLASEDKKEAFEEFFNSSIVGKIIKKNPSYSSKIVKKFKEIYNEYKSEIEDKFVKKMSSFIEKWIECDDSLMRIIHKKNLKGDSDEAKRNRAGITVLCESVLNKMEEIKNTLLSPSLTEEEEEKEEAVAPSTPKPVPSPVSTVSEEIPPPTPPRDVPPPTPPRDVPPPTPPRDVPPPTPPRDVSNKSTGVRPLPKTPRKSKKSSGEPSSRHPLERSRSEGTGMGGNSKKIAPPPQLKHSTLTPELLQEQLKNLGSAKKGSPKNGSVKNRLPESKSAPDDLPNVFMNRVPVLPQTQTNDSDSDSDFGEEDDYNTTTPVVVPPSVQQPHNASKTEDLRRSQSARNIADKKNPPYRPRSSSALPTAELDLTSITNRRKAFVGDDNDDGDDYGDDYNDEF